MRELRNAVERAVLLCAGDTLGVEHLPPEAAPAPTPRESAPPAEAHTLRTEIDALERARILDALQRCSGNQSRAAKLLGLSRSTLIARIEAYGLPRPRKE